jgi:hypothetical protein
LIVRLWGKPETRFGVFTKVEFSFRGALYASSAPARKKICFCLVLQAACVFAGSYESGVEIREAIPAYNPKREQLEFRISDLELRI